MNNKLPVRDEIPGITSFLYEANRFRKDSEYREYWKEIQITENKAEQRGITSLSLGGLVDQLSKIKAQLEEATDSYASLEKQWVELNTRHNSLACHHDEKSRQLKEVQPQLAHLEAQLILWMDATMDFGEHLDDCGWIEISASGRLVGAKEEECCTCGWYKKRMNLKSDTRFKNSRPKEVIVVKKKKGGSFKVNLDID